MKGLKLAEEYFYSHGLSMLRDKFSAYIDRIAVGLVGPGSECFGFDDEISRDHDWGPGFCLWIPEKDLAEIGNSLQKEYMKLPQKFKGYGPRVASPGEEWRVGVISIKKFYNTYTGLDHIPETNREWLYIPEQALATCVNGKIFRDTLGRFSQWRKSLLSFYPEDVRMKKISSRCMTIAQAGQYNFLRSVKRGDIFAGRYAENQFCTDVISLLFLLNRRYAPFYKWMYRAVRDLPILGEDLFRLIGELLSELDLNKKGEIMENISAILVKELREQGLSDSSSDFLLDQAHVIHEKIKDQKLRERFTVIR